MAVAKRRVIHVFGASGSGTSTLAKALCDKTGFRLMEVDDYFWLPSDPPFTNRRDSSESAALMQSDIDEHENVIIAGSATGWGDFLIPQLSLAIRLVVPTDIRINRIKQREYARFGKRIHRGGDMYNQHQAFLEWTSSYDEGGVDIRSKAQHDKWQEKLKCDLIIIDGTKSIKELVNDVFSKIIIGARVKGSVDRPIGSAHPKYPEMIYPVNYGYVDGVFAGDGEEQDVYVLGTTQPLDRFEGKVIAIYHRSNDNEDKWIVSSDGNDYTDEEILAAIRFQEQYYEGMLIR